jgi:hypothetical protein
MVMVIAHEPNIIIFIESTFVNSESEVRTKDRTKNPFGDEKDGSLQKGFVPRKKRLPCKNCILTTG